MFAFRASGVYLLAPEKRPAGLVGSTQRECGRIGACCGEGVDGVDGEDPGAGETFDEGNWDLVGGGDGAGGGRTQISSSSVSSARGDGPRVSTSGAIEGVGEAISIAGGERDPGGDDSLCGSPPDTELKSSCPFSA